MFDLAKVLSQVGADVADLKPIVIQIDTKGMKKLKYVVSNFKEKELCMRSLAGLLGEEVRLQTYYRLDDHTMVIIDSPEQQSTSHKERVFEWVRKVYVLAQLKAQKQNIRVAWVKVNLGDLVLRLPSGVQEELKVPHEEREAILLLYLLSLKYAGTWNRKWCIISHLFYDIKGARHQMKELFPSPLLPDTFATFQGLIWSGRLNDFYAFMFKPQEFMDAYLEARRESLGLEAQGKSQLSRSISKSEAKAEAKSKVKAKSKADLTPEPRPKSRKRKAMSTDPSPSTSTSTSTSISSPRDVSDSTSGGEPLAEPLPPSPPPKPFSSPKADTNPSPSPSPPREVESPKPQRKDSRASEASTQTPGPQRASEAPQTPEPQPASLTSASLGTVTPPPLEAPPQPQDPPVQDSLPRDATDVNASIPWTTKRKKAKPKAKRETPGAAAPSFGNRNIIPHYTAEPALPEIPPTSKKLWDKWVNRITKLSSVSLVWQSDNEHYLQLWWSVSNPRGKTSTRTSSISINRCVVAAPGMRDWLCWKLLQKLDIAQVKS